jgi:hypothetical protein
MNRKVVGVTVLTIALASGLVLLRIQPAAQGQVAVKGQQWEYKILNLNDNEFGQGKAETRFNQVAADGWEFVEVVVSRVAPPPAAVVVAPLGSTTCVLFKRARK